MPTIVLSSEAVEGTQQELVTIEIVANSTDFVGFFDVVEVWRSRSSSSGPYEQLTADSAQRARLPKTGQAPGAGAGPNVNVVGETLELVLNEKDHIVVTFTGANPLTLAQVASQIADQSAGRLTSYVDEAAHLVVETLAYGTGVALRVIPSDAASILALPMLEPDTIVFGKDAHIQLVAGQSEYRLVDQFGAKAYFYRTRYRNRATGAVSDYSLPFAAAEAADVNPNNTVIGYLELIANDGKPVVGRQVSISSPFNGSVIDGKLVAGNDLAKRTNEDGRVEFTLLRGQKYTVAVSGLDLSKEVTAPTDATVASFSLIDPAYSTQDDYFKVRVPQIPTLERRGF